MLPNVNNIEFSPDQTFIFFGNQTTSFNVGNGLTYRDMQTFTMPNNDSPNSLAFSNNEQWLVVGDKNGGVYFYSRQGNNFNPNPQDVETNTT